MNCSFMATWCDRTIFVWKSIGLVLKYGTLPSLRSFSALKKAKLLGCTVVFHSSLGTELQTTMGAWRVLFLLLKVLLEQQYLFLCLLTITGSRKFSYRGSETNCQLV